MKLWKPKPGNNILTILPFKTDVGKYEFPIHRIEDNESPWKCTGYDYDCPICEFIAYKNRLHEFIESKKGFWTEPFIK